MSNDEIYWYGVLALFITLLFISFKYRQDLKEPEVAAFIITLASVLSWAGIIIILVFILLRINIVKKEQ